MSPVILPDKFTQSPLPKASAAAFGNAEGVHPMGKLANAVKQSAISAPGRQTPGPIEGTCNENQ